MDLEHVELLRIQRELYALPRGRDRFEEYLRTMIDPATGDLARPLSAMNPMGKEHVPAFLDALLAFDAEGIAKKAITRARSELAAVPGAFRACLVVSDDLAGGWTNRAAGELGLRGGTKPLHRRGWITVLLWTSEAYTPERVHEEVLVAVHRTAHVQEHGFARSLREILKQEGRALARAGSAAYVLDPEDLAYSWSVIEPHLDAADPATLIAALLGDEAARSLGHRPLGLSKNAGLACACAQMPESL